jgi:hypothetical protein
VEAYEHSPDSGYRGETCELGRFLATEVRPMSFGWFLATRVRPVSLWPLVTRSNLGASSYLDIV